MDTKRRAISDQIFGDEVGITVKTGLSVDTSEKSSDHKKPASQCYNNFFGTSS
jgi:hypothetical protein